MVARGELLVSDVANATFQAWVSGFAYIRVNEASVEGEHSRISAILQRAPNVTTSTVSFELRYRDLCHDLQQSPAVSCLHAAVLSIV